jgi:uncharacterized protein
VSAPPLAAKPLLRPDAWHRSVLSLTPEWLAARGLEALLVDIDNTIAVWRSTDVSPEVREWLRQVREAGVAICILSNSRRPRRCKRIAADLDLPYIHWAGKPRVGGFRRALGLLGRTGPAGVAMVGDQLFTDILGGNRAGLYTVFVDVLSQYEFTGTKLLRPLERWILRRYGLTTPEA